MGYDLNRFVGQIDQEFICCICTLVLKEAMQSPCDHLFCSECIKEWLLVDDSCPVDRVYLNLDQIRPAVRFFRNLLNKLKIKCDFQPKGCESIVELEYLQNHLCICVYNPMSEIICDRGCNIKMCRFEYEANNCFTHFADRVIRQDEKITELSAVVSSQQEQNLKLIGEVNRHKAEITKLNFEVNRLREQIKVAPPKWRRHHNLNMTIAIEQPHILEIDDSTCTAFAQSFYSLEPGNSFKVQILKWRPGNWIVIGLTRKEHPSHDRPGWYEGSIGYSSYGTFEIDSKSQKVGDRWEDGDIIECGIKMFGNLTYHGSYNEWYYCNVTVYLSRNGQMVTENRIPMPRDGLFPTICMWDTKLKYLLN